MSPPYEVFSHPMIQHALRMDSFENLTPESFLAGPDRVDGDIVVDPVFATTIDDIFSDLCVDAGQKLFNFDRWTLLADHSGVFYHVVQNAKQQSFGIAACTTDVTACGKNSPQIIGLYTGSALAVKPEHRNRGIGTKLVAYRFLFDHKLPLWDHDKPGYSPAGYRVHQYAFFSLNAQIRA
jgi:GNAT superfamily N-acetyltransferase